MVVLAMKIAKILITLLIICLVCWLFRNKLNRKHNVCFVMLIIVFAFVANYLAGFLPALTDTVTLTALDEKQEQARSTEIFLNGYTIDDEEFLAGKSFQLESGNWFWSGEIYAWRSETDTRQPEGVTRSVVLRIPAGWNRSLNFNCNVWRGFVQIDNGQDVWVEDIYTEDSSEKIVYIGKSDTSLLIFNQVRYLLLYLVVLSALSALAVGITGKNLKNPVDMQEWLEKNYGKLIYASLSFVIFLLMFHYADRVSFWCDELYEISFTHGTLSEAIGYSVRMDDMTPPLMKFVATIWYHIAPYGEQWLLLVSIILTVVSIYVMGLIGESLGGRYLGYLSAAFLAFSTSVWFNVAYEYRAYALLVIFSVLSLYCYIKRNNVFSLSWQIGLAITLSGMAMSHYFGMIACAAYFIADIYLWFNKKIGLHQISFYSIPGAVSLGWLYIVFKNTSRDLGSSWQPVPSLSSIKNLLYFLSGNQEVTYWLLLLGIAAALAIIIRKYSVKFSWSVFYRKFCCLTVCLTIVALFLYGNFISPHSTLWSERYFLFLLPFVCLLTAWAVDDFGRLVLQRNVRGRMVLCIFFTLLLSINCFVAVSTSSSPEPYREAADWLYTQSNYIFNEDTLIISTSVPFVVDGWNDYYISRQGRRNSLNVVSQYSLQEENIEPYNRVYLQYNHWGVNSWLQSYLNDNFKLESDKTDIKVRTYIRK